MLSNRTGVAYGDIARRKSDDPLQMIRSITLIVVALSVTGCGMSREEYEVGQAKMRSSPAFRQGAMETCIDDADRAPAQERKRFAARHRIPEREVSRIACRRIVNAIAQDRLTYEEYREVFSSESGSKLLQAAEATY